MMETGDTPPMMRGIVNRVGDNYCYLNSILQNVIHNSSVRNSVLKAAAGITVVPISLIHNDAINCDDDDVFSLVEPSLPPTAVAVSRPCALHALSSTIDAYTDTANGMNPINITRLRAFVAHSEATFARGKMNDPSEVYEMLMHLLMRDISWHGTAGSSGCAPLPPAEMPQSEESFLAKATGFSHTDTWCCRNEGCKAYNTPITKRNIQHVCRLLVYPTLYNSDDTKRHNMIERVPAAEGEKFSDIIRSTQLRDEIFVCPSCGDRTPLTAARLWSPSSLAVYHLLWPKIPSTEETAAFLLRVLQEIIRVDDVWDAIIGADDTQETPCCTAGATTSPPPHRSSACLQGL